MYYVVIHAKELYTWVPSLSAQLKISLAKHGSMGCSYNVSSAFYLAFQYARHTWYV